MPCRVGGSRGIAWALPSPSLTQDASPAPPKDKQTAGGRGGAGGAQLRASSFPMPPGTLGQPPTGLLGTPISCCAVWGAVGTAACRGRAWHLLGALEHLERGLLMAGVPAPSDPSSLSTKACSQGSELDSWRADPRSLAGHRGQIGPGLRMGLPGAVGPPHPAALNTLPESGPPS